MSDALDVYWGDDDLPTGQIIQDSGKTFFRYENRTAKNRRISHSMPVDNSQRYETTFFENLLPDGVQRERLARQLGVSDSSTYTMLREVGGDCAGALTILPEGESPDLSIKSQVLDRSLLEQVMAVGAGPATLAIGARLSLAGAQNKLPVLVEGEDVFVPGGNTASSHILKLPSSDYKGLCSNEHFLLSLAAAVGLKVASSKIIHLHGQKLLLIDRYDRAQGKRLHQEDMCQAMGRPSSQKYEADGGSGFLDVIQILTDASTNPDDLLEIVRWQAFNIATGNNDGHNKNISLLREPEVRLAPAYDLVCTRAWPNLNKSLAFSVSGRRDAGLIGANSWRGFAEAASLSPRAVLREVQAIAAAVRGLVEATAEEAVENGADKTAVRSAASHVAKLSARSVKFLASGV